VTAGSMWETHHMNTATAIAYPNIALAMYSQGTTILLDYSQVSGW